MIFAGLLISLEILLPYRNSGFSKYFKHFLNRIIYNHVNSESEVNYIDQFLDVVKSLERVGASFDDVFTQRLRETVDSNGCFELEKVIEGKFSYESIGKRRDVREISLLGKRTFSKHVIVCEVDYHVSNAIKIIEKKYSRWLFSLRFLDIR